MTRDDRRTAVDHHRVCVLQARRCFAQRSCRQQASVAETPLAVHDDDFAVAHQGVMLQSIVAHDDVAAGIDQQLRRRRAIAADGNRHPRSARQHQRFIADGV